MENEQYITQFGKKKVLQNQRWVSLPNPSQNPPLDYDMFATPSGRCYSFYNDCSQLGGGDRGLTISSIRLANRTLGLVVTNQQFIGGALESAHISFSLSSSVHVPSLFHLLISLFPLGFFGWW